MIMEKPLNEKYSKTLISKPKVIIETEEGPKQMDFEKAINEGKLETSKEDDLKLLMRATAQRIEHYSKAIVECIDADRLDAIMPCLGFILSDSQTIDRHSGNNFDGFGAFLKSKL